MIAVMKKLALGIALIVISAAILLYSDLGSRRGSTTSSSKSGHPLRIAVVQQASTAALDEGIAGALAALKERGYVDGQRIMLRQYNAQGDIGVANAIAKEVTSGNFDLIFSASTVSLQTIANANRFATPPRKHVFGIVSDPYAVGVGINRENHLQHPAYMTGYGSLAPVEDTFRLARELRPSLKRVGLIWDPSEANSVVTSKLARTVCEKMGITLVEANAENVTAITEAAASLLARNVEAIWVSPDLIAGNGLGIIVSKARVAHIPVFTSIPRASVTGALFELGADYPAIGHAAGELAADVLDGRDPSTIPVENIMPITLQVDRTALSGLRDTWALPETVLARANVIVDDKGRHVIAAQQQQQERPLPLLLHWQATNEHLQRGYLMQITTHPGVGRVELRIAGRIDATWAEHLSTTIENTVRAGGHHILLNFAEVEYISSLGIRVLLVQYKLLKSVNGSLGISRPSEFCRNILTIVGLSEMMVEDAALETDAAIATPKQRRGAADYEIYPQAVSRNLSCQLVGNPALLSTSGFTADDCRTLTLPSGTFAVGMGAFGQNYLDCSDRFGEFLAAGGCVISLPTNEPHALPDYVIEEGHLVPQIETLYALTGEGDFSTMVRFDAAPDGPGKIALSELVDNLIDISSANAIAFVVLAEAAGVVGAALRKSPAQHPLIHTLPTVRDWLSFTTERTGEKNLCLIVGAASRAVDEDMRPFLRPLKAGSATSAHLHGALFPYRPVQRGELPFGTTIADLLSISSPNAVLHLMADTRPFEGVGETDLIRGACWFSPLTTISKAEHP